MAEALAGMPRRPDLLLEYLHRLHDRFSHLRVAHLVALASELRMAYAEVYEVATFYHNFAVVDDDAEPPPALTIRVCASLPCELAGSARLIARLRDMLGDGVRVREVQCLGRCAGAPAVLVGRRPLERASTDAVAAEVRGDGAESAGAREAQSAARRDAPRGALAGAPPAVPPGTPPQAPRDAPSAAPPATPSAVPTAAPPQTPSSTPSYPSYRAYRDGGGYALLAACAAGERSREGVRAEVEAAGLAGLGGAGFRVAAKWSAVLAGPAPRYVVLNADESEPGTFKDRYCLETDPHRVLEGALLAAWAVEAGDVYVYVRDEYAAVRDGLEREIAALEEDPPCAVPAMHVRRGAGSYICGEETALLESIEGRRAEPRLRPPYPAQVGLFGRPTLVHNVETVYWLREILEGGGERFAALGRHGAKGRRHYSVSGRVARPGVYAAPAGITARELIDDFAGGMLPGHALYAYLPAGASGGILPAALADEPLDFGRLERHGSFIGPAGVIVLSDRDRASAAALNLMRFFAHESCGECTPCRNGTARAVRLLEAGEWGGARVRDLCRVLCDASICGLGQAAPGGVRSVLRHFHQELEA